MESRHSVEAGTGHNSWHQDPHHAVAEYPHSKGVLRVVHHDMPRFKGEESDRQRVAKACAGCRKRKEKCDSELPCAHCKRRGSQCLYDPNRDSWIASTAGIRKEKSSVEYTSDAGLDSGEHRRPGSPGSSVGGRSKRPFVTPSNTADSPSTRSTRGASSSGDNPIWMGGGGGERSGFGRRGSRGDHTLRFANATEVSQEPDGQISSDVSEDGVSAAALDSRRRTKRRRHTTSTAARHHIASATTLAASEALVPRMPRRFRDGCGRSIFMGDSATPSFIHNVRQLALDLGGASDFTTDPLRHTFLDLPTPSPVSWSPLSDVNPTLEQAEMLANQYLTATTCLLDFLDVETLFRSIRLWLGGGSGGEDVLPQHLLYLVMAIGAQVTAEDMWTQMGEHYFAIGRQHALNYDVGDVSLEVVQIHILLATFALGASRRHAAFMYVGTAVRTAHALGLHQYSYHDAKPSTRHDPYACTWQSLRTLDLFLSITLGRPNATSEENMPNFPIGKDKTIISENATFASSIRRLSGILEMIPRDVYAKSMVSIAAVDNIATHLRQWSENLPPLPPIKPLANGPTTSMNSDKVRAIASAHLIGAHHWSIILLTRPLLLSHVLRVAGSSSTTNNEVDEPLEEESGSTTVTEAYPIAKIRKYAIGSIHSAMHIVEIADDLMRYADLPKRLPFVTNSIFNAALVIGVAHFGNFDKLFPLASLMDTVVRILNFMSVHDEVARRYAQVADYLRGAARSFVHVRNNSSLQSSRRTMNDMFGAVGPSLKREPTQTLPDFISMPYGHDIQRWQANNVYDGMLIGSTGEIIGDVASSNSVVPLPVDSGQKDGHLFSTEGVQFLTAPEVFLRPGYMLTNLPLSSMSPAEDQQVHGVLQQGEQNNILSAPNISEANRI